MRNQSKHTPSLGDDPVNSSSMEVERPKEKQQDLEHTIKRTWRTLRWSMVGLVLLAFLAAGFLIAGSVFLSRATNHLLVLQDEFNSAIDSFKNNEYVQLQATQFSLSVNNNAFPLHPTVDPFQNIVDHNSGVLYNSSVFTTTSPFPVVGDWTPPDELQVLSGAINSSTIVFTVNYSFDFWNSQTSFAVSAPVMKVEKTCSSKDGEKQCSAIGGYFEKQTLNCLRLFVAINFCIQVVDNNIQGWDANPNGVGCVYPFDSPSLFEQYSYTTNITQLLETSNFTFTLRSTKDPYVVLQAMTKGKMSLHAVEEEMRDNGINFITLACIVIVIALTLATTLFFVKRKMKRNYKTASRIPHHYSRPPMFRYLALSLFCFGICIGVGFPLLGHWAEILTGWTYTPFIGLMLVIWTCPMGMISLLIFWQMLIKSPAWSLKVRSMLGGLVGAVVMVLAALSVAVLMKPWQLVYSLDPSAPDQLEVFFGIVYALTFFPLATLLLVICGKLLFKDTQDDYDRTDTMTSSRIISHRAVPGIAFGLLGVYILFVVFLATAFLPPIWNTLIVGYNTFVSKFSLVPATHSTIVIMKLYVDVVVFYGFVLGVVLVGLLARLSQKFKRLASKWVRLRLPMITFDSSIAEITFLLCVIGLSVWWFWFWYSGYQRIADIPYTLERLARALGHMTNLFAALLLFPVTRNSMWVEILGIPFERAIQYHRWAGVIVFFALSAHMLVWWIEWSTRGYLLHNIFSMSLYLAQYPDLPHTDNWSIPIVELTWLGAAVMVLLSQSWFRRNRFELFYYTHHFFIVFYITGLIHSWSMWYFTGGGMILWFVDRLIRFYKSSKVFPVTDIQVLHSGDTTQLALQPNGFSFRAGQYAFINIPSISPLEWHPFTISSAPGETALTFHIKSMGKTSWTARLARIYGGEGNAFAPVTSLPIVNIDGPYGNPPNFLSHKTVVLVAGGIGITPMISIVKDLHQLRKQNALSLKKVYLMWVVRDLAMLDMFRDVFDEISIESKDIFQIVLRVTQRSFANTTASTINPPPIMGRPNIQQEFADIASSHGSDVLAMVCGPAPMVKEVQNAAYHCKFELHMETFEL